MIASKKELKFYITADYIMNRGTTKPSLSRRLMNVFCGDDIMRYLKAMRKYSYYKSKNIITPPLLYNWFVFNRLGKKLGFSIGPDTLGYGVVIPHYGTIVVGPSNKIGNYAVLHTSTCITDNCKEIGDGLYLSTGAKVTSKLILGNNISIGANSVVNKSFIADNIMIAGVPAYIIKDMSAWYIRDGITFQKRVNAVEELKREMGIFSSHDN